MLHAGWIKVLLLPQSLVWLLGFGGNHSLLFFVQYCRHHISFTQPHDSFLKHEKEVEFAGFEQSADLGHSALDCSATMNPQNTTLL